MFAEETEKLVNELIQAEYQNACKQAEKEFNDEYTDKYHSLYEGYAVLEEEVEEVTSEIVNLNDWLKRFWETVKDSSYCKPMKYVVEMQIFVENSIKELAQVGAVLQKIKNTCSEMKNETIL